MACLPDRHGRAAAGLAGRAERMAGVLDNRDALVVGQRRDLLHRGRLAGEMHRKHHANPPVAPARSSASAMWSAPMSPVSGSTSANTTSAPVRTDGVGGGEEGDGGNNRRIARSEPDAHGGQVKRCRAVGADHCAGRAYDRGEGALEGCDDRAGGQGIAAEHLRDRGNVVLLHAVPAVLQERRHTASISRRICSISSHSSLVSLA